MRRVLLVKGTTWRRFSRCIRRSSVRMTAGRVFWISPHARRRSRREAHRLFSFQGVANVADQRLHPFVRFRLFLWIGRNE